MIVVTGASGFIGSNLVMELNRRRYTDIVAVDDYPWLRGRARLHPLSPEVRYSQCMKVAGCVDMHSLNEWLQGSGSTVSSIIHLGACSDTTASDRDWIMENNLAYTQRLWQWCADARRTFVYASSAATYGDGLQGYDDACSPSRYQPLNLYGESKHLFDLWGLSQRKAPPRWAGLKYFNVYGPRETHKGRMASMVFHGFHQILETGSIRLFRSNQTHMGDGEQQRDFVCVKDVVAATLHFAADSNRYENGLYNVGTGRARAFNELANAIFAALGRQPRIEYISMPQDLRGRYQDFTQAVLFKLREAGYTSAMTSLEDGVRDYVLNHLAQKALAA